MVTNKQRKAVTAVIFSIAMSVIIGVMGYLIMNAYESEMNTRCMELQAINQCFSDGSCIRTGDDYVRRTQLEREVRPDCYNPK